MDLDVEWWVGGGWQMDEIVCKAVDCNWYELQIVRMDRRQDNPKIVQVYSKWRIDAMDCNCLNGCKKWRIGRVTFL